MCTAVECGTPTNGENTVPVPAEVDLVFGQEYVYSCLSGYEPTSVDMVMVTNCTSAGDFSLDVLPKCTGKNDSKKLSFAVTMWTDVQALY